VYIPEFSSVSGVGYGIDEFIKKYLVKHQGQKEKGIIKNKDFKAGYTQYGSQPTKKSHGKG